MSAKYTTALQTNTWYHICASFKWTTGTDGILKAYLTEKKEVPGIDRYIAISQNGSGFEWRQLNEKYME